MRPRRRCSAASWAAPAGPAAPGQPGSRRSARRPPGGDKALSAPEHGRRRPVIVGRPCRTRPRSVVEPRGRPRMLRAWTPARRHPHPALPRGGAGRLAVDGPTRRRRRTSSPVWFWWDGDVAPRLLQARRREGPQPARATGRDARRRRRGGGLRHRPVRGPRRDPRRADAERLPAGHLEKYASQMAGIGLTPAEYAETYRWSSGSPRATTSAGTAGRSRRASASPVRRGRPSRSRPSAGRACATGWASRSPAACAASGVGLLRPGAAGAL